MQHSTRWNRELNNYKSGKCSLRRSHPSEHLQFQALTSLGKYVLSECSKNDKSSAYHSENQKMWNTPQNSTKAVFQVFAVLQNVFNSQKGLCIFSLFNRPSEKWFRNSWTASDFTSYINVTASADMNPHLNFKGFVPRE